eukprot:TRINITY_DN66028_c6_g6_i1.p1 TRINITY_DN66028_c6_g6~~TRINITY_DN66028_c6_g6_i1.p1  ORF type:complete len:1294 (-),score=688.63 TRINITY_DN66028_c6_g6_i1:115-3921(-)
MADWASAMAMDDESSTTAVTTSTVTDDEPSSKRQRVVAPPTAEELETLRETSEQFRSNLFRLELQELLAEVRVDYERKGHDKLKAFLRRLKQSLDGMPERTVVATGANNNNNNNNNSSSNKSDIVVTSALGLMPHREDKAVRLTMRKPERVDLVGSYLLQAQLKTDKKCVVDVVVQVPSDNFLKSDYVNHRYHDKRALYLHGVAHHLQTQMKEGQLLLADVCVSYVRGDRSRPMLVLKSRSLKKFADADEDVVAAGGHLPKGFEVRIFAGLAHDVFPVSKFRPTRNNVRSCHRAGRTDALLPTPQYNTGVLEDMFFVDHLRLLHPLLTDNPSVLDAVLLYKVWARQRELSAAFSGFHFAMLVHHLVTQRKVFVHMSCYQIFRVALLALVNQDWSRADQAVTVGKSAAQNDRSTDADSFSVDNFARAFDVVMLDPTGVLNLLAHLDASQYAVLRDEAKRSIQYIDDNVDDGFRDVFLKSVRFFSKHDVYVRLDGHVIAQVQRQLLKSTQTGGADDAKNNNNSNNNNNNNKSSTVLSMTKRFPTVDFHAAVRDRVLTTLRRALGDRVALMELQPRAPHEWSLCNAAARHIAVEEIVAGISVDPEHSMRLVDRGPPADATSKAKRFRAFWGAKSELRRFKDGAILEAVVWRESNVGVQPHTIVGDIVKYILPRQVHVRAADVHLFGSQFDSFLHNRTTLNRHWQRATKDPMRTTSKLFAAYRSLVDLVNAADVPLSVLSIQAVHPAFYHAAPFPPQPRRVDKLAQIGSHDVSQAVEPIDVIVQFQRSSNWPDDVLAIERIKSAFYLQMAAQFTEKHGKQCVVSQTFVDVFVNGYAFRVRIVHDMELLLRRAKAQAPEVEELKERERLERLGQASAAQRKKNEPYVRKSQLQMLKWDRLYTFRPRLSNQLRGFQGRHAAYGPTVRLAKRWIAAHMLSTRVEDTFGAGLCDEAIELLVAYTFLRPQPYRQPNSAFAGLQRFLQLLSTFEWADQPLVVDINDELTAETRARIAERFDQCRSRATGRAAMFIATPQDMDSLAWTYYHPTPPMLGRLASFASASLAYLHRLLSTAPTEQSRPFKTMFKTPLDEYDVRIVLRLDAIQRLPQSIFISSQATTLEEQAQRLKQRQSVQQAGKKKNKEEDGVAAEEVEDDGKSYEARQGELLVGFEPIVEYLAELRRTFGQVAHFFYDPLGGDTIHMAWRPDAFKPHKFNVHNATHGKPVLVKKTKERKKNDKKRKRGDGSEAMVVANRDQILADIQAMGAGLVRALVHQ